MSNRTLRVKTSGRGSDWCYSVLSPDGRVLITRRAYPSEYAARNAGWAAADALSPVTVAMRLTQDRPAQVDWRAMRPANSKPSFWRSLFR
ncbi:MAG: hypothetical protein Q8R82_13825 [Hyphomonadaceae bacterium]|nr:hypothetical protein [Hyphomonadaceae bacterium]